MGPIWAAQIFPTFTPYGAHMGPGFKNHMGPILLPIWALYRGVLAGPMLLAFPYGAARMRPIRGRGAKLIWAYLGPIWAPYGDNLKEICAAYIWST